MTVFLEEDHSLREQIRNPNLIHPGQIFVLPAR
jgi:nucleoid-associated protein YgaU